MTNDKILKVATILLLATTIPFVGWSSVHAQDEDTSATVAAGDDPAPPMDEEHGDPEFKQALIKHHEKMFFKRVDATPAQQEKISKIFADARAAKEPLWHQMHEQMKQMHDLMANADSTDQQIKDQAHAVRQVEDKLKDQRLDTMLKIRAVLTPKQREDLKSDCCEEAGHKGMHGHGHWGG
jgi:Spy/CpxP family protein refolding chaperone